MCIAKLCKDFAVSSFKGVTPTDVNEGCAQDFAGRIEPHMLSTSPCEVTANQHVLCIVPDVLADQFPCDREI